MCDIYDSPAWQNFMGPITVPNTRLGFQFCIDGIPAFAEGSYSIKPLVLMNFSLSPVERIKPENMLILLVMPTYIKDPCAKKYFDFAETFELNELFHVGVEGFHVKMFGSSLDTPGRSELNGMQSSLAYQGCSVCLHSWSAGAPLGQKKCINDGYRRYLAVGARGRSSTFRYRGNTYQYG